MTHQSVSLDREGEVDWAECCSAFREAGCPKRPPNLQLEVAGSYTRGAVGKPVAPLGHLSGRLQLGRDHASQQADQLHQYSQAISAASSRL
jgi:hypothetical protein